MINVKFLKKLLLILILACNTFAQGNYLDNNQSGFSVGFGFGTNSDVSALSGGIGYSVGGAYDLKFGIDRLSFDEGFTSNDDLSSLNFNIGIEAYPIKQTRNDYPITFSVDFGYERANFSSDFLDLAKWDMTANYYHIGFNIYRKDKITPKTSIQPYCGFTYVMYNGKISDSFGGSEKYDDNTTVFNFGTSLLFFTANKSIFSTSIGISINDENTTFNLGISLIVPSKY